MSETYRIGIDVGGTNTDAVILDCQDRVIAKVKKPTTPDVGSGIRSAMQAVLQASGLDVTSITQVMFGTTHCTNAIATRQGLVKVGVVRLGAPATTAIPPLFTWPADLRDSVLIRSVVLRGGHEFTGDEISALDEAGLRSTARAMKSKVQAIAITGVFSPVNPEHEARARAILQDELGSEISITISSEIGSIGLLERENAAALNAALTGVARDAIHGFQRAVAELGLNATLYLGQNDGTLMSVEEALRFPVLTIASGPSNSIRGAGFLSGQRNAVVVDIGGTTSDLGILQNGFPRQSMEAAEIGGVRTNFRMPDLLSIPLGGGSRVREIDSDVIIGPESVEYQLTERARVFGGSELTATDLAVAAGRVELGDRGALIGLRPDLVDRAFARIQEMLEESVDRVKVNAQDISVVVVGGGSMLFPDDMKGVAKIIRPEHYEVANAIGVGIAQISATFDRVIALTAAGRRDVLDEAQRELFEQLTGAGAAADSIEILEIEEVPLAYLPGGASRVRMKAAGRLTHPENVRK